MPKSPITVNVSPYDYVYGWAHDATLVIFHDDTPGAATTTYRGDIRFRWHKGGISIRGRSGRTRTYPANSEVIGTCDGAVMSTNLDKFGMHFAYHEHRS